MIIHNLRLSRRAGGQMRRACLYRYPASRSHLSEPWLMYFARYNALQKRST